MQEIPSLDVMNAGIAIFMVFHLLIGVYEARERMLNVMGKGGYRATHSIFALLGLGLIIIGYMGREFVPLYDPPAYARYVTLVLMFCAMVFVVGTFTPGKIQNITRHPMLMGVILWSLAHLIANGDKASVILFASFGVYAVLATLFAERKARISDPAAHAEVKARTSIIPFLAMIQGRTDPAHSGDKGVRALIWGTLMFLLFGFGHIYVIGVPAIMAN